MIAELITGKLTHVDTEKKVLVMDDKDDFIIHTFALGARMQKWRDGVWASVIGCNVEVSVVKGIAVGLTNLDDQRKTRQKIASNKA